MWPELASVLAQETEEAWGGGKRSFSRDANHLLQRLLVVSSQEVSHLALFDPGPKVVLGFK